MAGRHGNKGVISKILPIGTWPYQPTAPPSGHHLEPLGVPSRMKRPARCLESHLGYAPRWGAGKEPDPRRRRRFRVLRPRPGRGRPVGRVSTRCSTGPPTGRGKADAGKHPTIRRS